MQYTEYFNDDGDSKGFSEVQDIHIGKKINVESLKKECVGHVKK